MYNISFVILTWNSDKYIFNCLNSILECKNINSQIIIIDNGSKDNTLNIIDSLKEDNINIELIKNTTNVGTTISRNQGLNRVKKGNLICILDSDTIINELAIVKLADFLNNNKTCGIVGPKMLTSGGIVQMSARNFPTITDKFLKAIPIAYFQKKAELYEVPNGAKNNVNYECDYLMSACWLMQSDILNKVGFLDENIFYAPEDAEYCIRVWKSEYTVNYFGETSIIHEWQRISKKKLLSKMNLVHIQGLWYMFKKHKYYFSLNKIRKQFKSAN